MKKTFLMLSLCALSLAGWAKGLALYPQHKSTNVNVDTRLTLSFDKTPRVGQSGWIRVYDLTTGLAVDSLDLSLPAGPTESQPRLASAVYTPVPYNYSPRRATNRDTKPGTASGVNKPDSGLYQLNIIGGFTDGFHFHPVLVRGNKAVIYLHNNVLEYGHQYAVTVDRGAIVSADGKFKGIRKGEWTFTVKATEPNPADRTLVVSADGTADYSTLQGAMDRVPDNIVTPAEGWTVKVKNGDDEEIVYFRNKQYVRLQGESRDGVVVHYANNEVFNPHPLGIKANEWPGTFPSRRAAFAIDNCRYITVTDMTIKTDLEGQAEGLLVNGSHNTFSNVHIIGSGDALQTNGSAYYKDCTVDGGGDTVLGRGPAFFERCSLRSKGAFMWIRNTNANHGDVFVNCTFEGLGDDTELARSPVNKGTGYPYAEAVLIGCKLKNIAPCGWKSIDGDTTYVRFWEFDSRDFNGNPVDVSRRHPASRQLNAEKDKAIIASYKSRQFVLGW